MLFSRSENPCVWSSAPPPPLPRLRADRPGPAKALSTVHCGQNPLFPRSGEGPHTHWGGLGHPLPLPTAPQHLSPTQSPCTPCQPTAPPSTQGQRHTWSPPVSPTLSPTLGGPVGGSQTHAPGCLLCTHLASAFVAPPLPPPHSHQIILHSSADLFLRA